MKKNLIVLLCLLALALCLAGCNGSQTSPNEDKQSQQETAPPSAAAYATQIQQLCAEATVMDEIAPNQKAIELTPEIKGLFFDLAQVERWDFLPAFGFDGSEPPTEMSDYIYLVIAQSLVWENYYCIDHELTPEKLSTEYVDAFIAARFSLPVPHPEPSVVNETVEYKSLAFDGEYYSSPYAEWAYPPLYGLSMLTVDNSNPNTTVYEASLLYYAAADGSIDIPDNAREIICSLDEDKPGLIATSQLRVRFYFSENGVPVYLAVEFPGQ